MQTIEALMWLRDLRAALCRPCGSAISAERKAFMAAVDVAISALERIKRGVWNSVVNNDEAIAIITQYVGLGWNPRYYEALSLAVDALERDRWISVEERLPEEDSSNRYIVYAIDPYFGVKIIDFMRFSGCWFVDGIPTKATVTHWRPLPEPPKEGT